MPPRHHRTLHGYRQGVLVICLCLLAVACTVRERLFAPPAGSQPTVAHEISCETESGQKWCSFRLALTGNIQPKDVAAVREALEMAAREPRIAVERITIDSSGGNALAGFAIGRLLRQHGRSLHVARDARCYSACVLVLAGAVSRQVEGSVGIHHPTIDLPGSTPAEADSFFAGFHDELRDYLREMRVPGALADATMQAPAHGMRILSPAELDSFRLSRPDPLWEAAIAAKDVVGWGLSRDAYADRERLVAEICPASGAERTVCRGHVLAWR